MGQAGLVGRAGRLRDRGAAKVEPGAEDKGKGGSRVDLGRKGAAGRRVQKVGRRGEAALGCRIDFGQGGSREERERFLRQLGWGEDRGWRCG